MKYTRTETIHFFSNLKMNFKKMKAELNEHRYFLERNVEQRTVHLQKRIAVLEVCNKTLCDKLAEARTEIAELKQMAAVRKQDNVEVKADHVMLPAKMPGHYGQANCSDSI